MNPGFENLDRVSVKGERNDIENINLRTEEYINKRDYQRAINFLKLVCKDYHELNISPWLGYCYFHLGSYSTALAVYNEISEDKHLIHVNKACCYFKMQMYNEALKELECSENSNLKIRILFHISHHQKDEDNVMKFHKILEDTVENQITLAAVHYCRCHYQEALEIYKKIIASNKNFIALHIYMALCYYKLDNYDVSQDLVALYLQNFPDSIVSINLKACNHFCLYNKKAAITELKFLKKRLNGACIDFGKEIIEHNLVVMQDGENILQVLPMLFDLIPEAKLNLIIYFLKHEKIHEAFELVKDLTDTVASVYILKAILYTRIYQENYSEEYLQKAQHYFSIVGSSISECDTIAGRQCMASYFFLLNDYDNVLLYLTSIKNYFYGDDVYNYNYAQAKASVGKYEEAEEVLLMIQNERIKKEYCYISWLIKCYIQNGKPNKAWMLYENLDSDFDKLKILKLISNECYRLGQFYYSAKAFNVLEKLNPKSSNWVGKRAACIGVIQLIAQGQESQDNLDDVLKFLSETNSKESLELLEVIKQWAKK